MAPTARSVSLLSGRRFADEHRVRAMTASVDSASCRSSLASATYSFFDAGAVSATCSMPRRYEQMTVEGRAIETPMEGFAELHKAFDRLVRSAKQCSRPPPFLRSLARRPRRDRRRTLPAARLWWHRQQVSLAVHVVKTIGDPLGAVGSAPLPVRVTEVARRPRGLQCALDPQAVAHRSCSTPPRRRN